MHLGAFSFRLQNYHVQQWADKVVDFFSNVEKHITHGRLILAREISQLHVPAATVVELVETDEHWLLLWELYVRCEVYLNTNPVKGLFQY